MNQLRKGYYNTPGTRIGAGGCNRTMAVKNKEKKLKRPQILWIFAFYIFLLGRVRLGLPLETIRSKSFLGIFFIYYCISSSGSSWFCPTFRSQINIGRVFESFSSYFGSWPWVVYISVEILTVQVFLAGVWIIISIYYLDLILTPHLAW